VICDTREEAVRYWKGVKGCCHLALSFALGPDPYPQINQDFQSLLGHETDLQLRAKRGEAHPRAMISSLHSDADAIGFNLMYLNRPEVALHCAEPEHPAPWSPSPRLRPYNNAVREHTWLRSLGRIRHVPISDAKAEVAREQMRLYEKIDVSLEDARAVALLLDLMQYETRARDYVVLID
jgi:tryptophan synthase beta chain